MSTAYWVTGDTLDVLRSMPDGCVDLCLTSPPFLALRSYLPADDPAKAQEIGQEGTPGAFLDVLLDITEELRRVLAPHGSIAVELGDTYAGSGGAGGDYMENGRREGQQLFKRSASKSEVGEGWPEAKSLCLIPELYRFALAYGFNPLTGRQCSRWRVRNVVRWVRPNPPVGALGDKYRPATSEMVVACMSGKRYFDLDAVRHPADPANKRPSELKRSGIGGRTDQVMNPLGPDGQRIISNAAGAPPLDWWEIPTAPYKGSHYATYPPALCEKPIKSMAPQKVCMVCGKPSERITERSHVDAETGERVDLPEKDIYESDIPREVRGMQPGNGSHARVNAAPITLGWTDCGHDAWRPGRVLDIFGGSGTTLAVATGHGRDAIGIDLDARNAELARERIGPMFFHEVTVDELADILDPPEAAA